MMANPIFLPLYPLSHHLKKFSFCLSNSNYHSSCNPSFSTEKIFLHSFVVTSWIFGAFFLKTPGWSLKAFFNVLLSATTSLPCGLFPLLYYFLETYRPNFLSVLKKPRQPNQLRYSWSVIFPVACDRRTGKLKSE